MEDLIEEEVIISCAKCGTTPDDVLILTCDHNLCLICAAKNLKREQQKSKHSYQTVICDICGSPTVLDPTSASELLSMAPESNSPKEKQEYKYEENSESTEPSSYARYMQKSSTPFNNKSGITQGPSTRVKEIKPRAVGFCAQHPDEDIKYFCFGCMGAPVCAECVVHGMHKGHDVMNIKKAYPAIKGKLEDNVMHINGRVHELQVHSDSVNQRKKDLVEQYNSINSQTRNLFEELRIRIKQKEHELIEVSDADMENHMGELKTYEKVVRNKIENLHSNSEYLRANMGNLSVIELLEFYGTNYEGIGQMMEGDVDKMESLRDIQNAKLFVDMATLRNFKENISQIAENVGSLNPIQLHSYNSSFQHSDK